MLHTGDGVSNGGKIGDGNGFGIDTPFDVCIKYAQSAVKSRVCERRNVKMQNTLLRWTGKTKNIDTPDTVYSAKTANPMKMAVCGVGRPKFLEKFLKNI